MVYNKNMIKYAFLLLIVVFASCVYYGSGIRTVTGTISGTVPANVKIGLFPPDEPNIFIYDEQNATDKDIIDRNNSGATTGSFSPVLFESAAADGTFSIEFPEDPATIKCLVAWDDLNGDNIFDLGSEDAYLPVKTINGTDYVVHHFTYIEVTEVITYLAVYSNMDPQSVDFDTLYDDNFDAIGAEGYNFNFR